MSEIQSLPSSAIIAMNLPFKKGEKVVYPAHGVAVIEDIQMRVISGTERRFYMLRILGTEKMTIMIPTENVESVGLRRVIGKDMVEKIYRILRQRKVRSIRKRGTAATANTPKRLRPVRRWKSPRCCATCWCLRA